MIPWEKTLYYKKEYVHYRKKYFAIFVQVYVNGVQHCLFKHRIPLEKVSAIDIRGNVTMNLLGLIKVSDFFSILKKFYCNKMFCFKINKCIYFIIEIMLDGITFP